MDTSLFTLKTRIVTRTSAIRATMVFVLLLIYLGGCMGPNERSSAGTVDSIFHEDESEDPNNTPGDTDIVESETFECNSLTPGIGAACSNSDSALSCGVVRCCYEGNPLCAAGVLTFCDDPGSNLCGTCGDLDTTTGELGASCGAFGCGVMGCNEEGSATACIGDHEPNLCGGCDALSFEGSFEANEIDANNLELEAGDACSECMTGTWTCAADLHTLTCMGGQSSDNVCGICGPCVLAEANLEIYFDGAYIQNGTRIIVESIDATRRMIRFDPFIPGPGFAGLARTQIALVEEIGQFNRPRIPLSPMLSNTVSNVSPDADRLFILPETTDLSNFNFIEIYDAFLDRVLAAGALELNP